MFRHFSLRIIAIIWLVIAFFYRTLCVWAGLFFRFRFSLKFWWSSGKKREQISIPHYYNLDNFALQTTNIIQFDWIWAHEMVFPFCILAKEEIGHRWITSYFSLSLSHFHLIQFLFTYFYPLLLSFSVMSVSISHVYCYFNKTI